MSPIQSAFHHQAEWCTRLGSPFTAALIEALLHHLTPDGRLTPLLTPWPGDPTADILPLRVTGALHALVLSNAATTLAALYPPNPIPTRQALIDATGETLTTHASFIKTFLISPPQTNEVARAAVLLPGFLHIAATTQKPLRLLEIGASAGLNLLWDKFHYRLGGGRWGDPASPVQLAPDWTGHLPNLATPITITARLGCDIAPIDVTDPHACLRLRAYVWPDQTDRLARLTGALTLALHTPATPTKANATDFLRAHLTQRHRGEVTALYHSIMWNYVTAADRADITAIVGQAGQNATRDTPLAWLRFEIPAQDALPTLMLTQWPGGETIHLATAHPHGAAITWHG